MRALRNAKPIYWIFALAIAAVVACGGETIVEKKVVETVIVEKEVGVKGDTVLQTVVVEKMVKGDTVVVLAQQRRGQASAADKGDRDEFARGRGGRRASYG